MSKHISNEARDPDSCCKRMMAILLDGAFITLDDAHNGSSRYTFNTYVAKDFDDLVDKMLLYVQQRDHAILAKVMEQMDNNFIEKQKAKHETTPL